jgi:molecular chaperone GrpE
MPSSRVSDDQEQQERRAEGAAQAAQAAEQDEQPQAEQAAQRDDERYLRALADLENYRKRSAQEVDRRVTERTEQQLLEWLEAVDSVERALRMRASDGLRTVLEQMDAILARQGVERVGAEGDRFDPELHEAVAVGESGEAPDRTVLDVARSGYRRGDRVLRPAQVVVSRRPEERDGED